MENKNNSGQSLIEFLILLIFFSSLLASTRLISQRQKTYADQSKLTTSNNSYNKKNLGEHLFKK